jgi:hypothetical protein
MLKRYTEAPALPPAAHVEAGRRCVFLQTCQGALIQKAGGRHRRRWLCP